MFLTQKEYLTFIADPKQYERVSALLHDEFKSRGLQYFVPAGGYFAATRTTGRTVVACARVSPLLGSTGSYLIRNIVGDPTKLLKMVVRELRARGGKQLVLNIDASNTAAMRYYTSEGFISTGTKSNTEKEYMKMVKEF